MLRPLIQALPFPSSRDWFYAMNRAAAARGRDAIAEAWLKVKEDLASKAVPGSRDAHATLKQQAGFQTACLSSSVYSMAK